MAFVFTFSFAEHKDSPVCMSDQAVLIQSLPRALELGLQGGLHWPVGLPQHVVAGASVQDVLCCPVLQAAGGRVGERTGLVVVTVCGTCFRALVHFET